MASLRGDVATAVKGNPALVEMMQRAMACMMVDGMLKQAGADTGSMKQFNRILQMIKKDLHPSGMIIGMNISNHKLGDYRGSSSSYRKMSRRFIESGVI